MSCLCRVVCPFSQYEDYIAGVEVYSEYVDDKSNHQRVVYKFTPHQFRGINRIDVKGAALMPPEVGQGAWVCVMWVWRLVWGCVDGCRTSV